MVVVFDNWGKSWMPHNSAGDLFGMVNSCGCNRDLPRSRGWKCHKLNHLSVKTGAIYFKPQDTFSMRPIIFFGGEAQFPSPDSTTRRSSLPLRRPVGLAFISNSAHSDAPKPEFEPQHSSWRVNEAFPPSPEGTVFPGSSQKKWQPPTHTRL